MVGRDSGNGGRWGEPTSWQVPGCMARIPGPVLDGRRFRSLDDLEGIDVRSTHYVGPALAQ